MGFQNSHWDAEIPWNHRVLLFVFTDSTIRTDSFDAASTISFRSIRLTLCGLPDSMQWFMNAYTTPKKDCIANWWFETVSRVAITSEHEITFARQNVRRCVVFNLRRAICFPYFAFQRIGTSRRNVMEMRWKMKSEMREASNNITADGMRRIEGKKRDRQDFNFVWSLLLALEENGRQKTRTNIQINPWIDTND